MFLRSQTVVNCPNVCVLLAIARDSVSGRNTHAWLLAMDIKMDFDNTFIKIGTE